MVKIVLFLLAFVFILLGYASIWCVLLIGDVSFEKIVFHMHMPLKQANIEWVKGWYIPLICCIVTCLYIYYFPKNKITTFFKSNIKCMNKKISRIVFFCVCFL